MGKQAPPTRAAPSLVGALRDARGALLFATGTSLPQRRRGVLFRRRSGVPIACRLTRNITSSKEYGIKEWTDEQIIRVLTQGISADGRRLAPPMSGRAPIWAQLTERDKHDLVAYLRSLPPQE